ncbi:MAG: hypothetical protein KME64_28795 [Scytonematopsis contorta HA4267-MV1]|jgi:hypothetical protein|nr:hypothetical protein [Scytonematopsis contorta HA4267-MV1]
MTREEWQLATDRLRANQDKGQADEDAALEALNIQNNNYARTPDGKLRNPITYESDEGIVTRPDGVTESKWVDVKSVDKGTVYYTEQLRAQKEGARKGHPDGKQRDLTVVLSNINRTEVQPSRPLADSADVLHRNSQNGQWSFWDKRANKGQGAWQNITDDQAASILGSEI